MRMLVILTRWAKRLDLYSPVYLCLLFLEWAYTPVFWLSWSKTRWMRERSRSKVNIIQDQSEKLLVIDSHKFKKETETLNEHLSKKSLKFSPSRFMLLRFSK